MRKRLWALLLAFGMVCALFGCGDRKPEEPEKPESIPVEEAELPPMEKEPQEPETPAGINVLTGLPIEPEYENNRPVAVILNNVKKAQPHLGISQADIVYETEVEGGITRMLGVFQRIDNVPNLGSIRSVRPYFLELALGHDALLVHAGGSETAYSDIRAWDVDNMDGVRGSSDAKIFWRDPDRKKNAGYEHSLLTSGENISHYLDSGRYRTTHPEGYFYPQNFCETIPAAMEIGEAASHLTVCFSYYKTGTFDYDAESGKYLVKQYGMPYIDGNTGESVGFTNVLVLKTGISNTGDSHGHLLINLDGEGDGLYFCGGKTIPIHWSKTGHSGSLQYTAEDGSPLTMQCGNSYVCILSPNRSTVSYE